MGLLSKAIANFKIKLFLLEGWRLIFPGLGVNLEWLRLVDRAIATKLVSDLIIMYYVG